MAKKEPFAAPTREEAITLVKNFRSTYSQQQIESVVDEFLDHFRSNGWKVSGKTPMVDWQAALRNWVRRNEKWSPQQKDNNSQGRLVL